MRAIDPDLLDCLRRPDSYVEYGVELTAPDVSHVLRRQSDQFFSTPPGVAGSETGGAFAAAVTGGMQLAATAHDLATYPTHVGGGELDVKQGKPTRFFSGVAWTVDPSFQRAIARAFTARVLRRRAVLGVAYSLIVDWQLQIYRITRTPGASIVGGGPAPSQYVFTPLLSSGPIVPAAGIAWSVDDQADLTWDLSPYALAFEASPTAGINPNVSVELPVYLFVIEPLHLPDVPTRNLEWLLNTATAQTVAGVGTFAHQEWSRDGDEALWTSQTFADTPVCTLTVDAYPASGSKIYALDLGRAPTIGTVGRVAFNRQLPRGTNATLELATAGAAGPWTLVKSGDVVALAQQQYWTRVTLLADAALSSTPIVNALGVEFRIPYDIGDLSIAATPSRDISVPFLEASIAEATLRVLRVGERDYLDQATIIGSTAPTPKLEVDIFLRSRHPMILGDRSKWLHLERLSVSDREPGQTSESFQLLSYSKNLAFKVPAQVETINTVHTVVAGTTTTAVTVLEALTGTTPAGGEYNGRQYYIRLRSTSTELSVGYSPAILGSTGINRLDFAAGVFPIALAPGDVIEVHSGITATPTLKWQNADPAQIWDDLIAQCPNISADRVGRGDLPRSGRPPRLTDRFPGDVAAQAKGTISFELKDQAEAGKLLDQVSFHLGGATVEMGGQICFVQIYPLVNAEGKITVPLARVAAIFDVRDIVGGSLKTKPNVASRLAVVSAKFGVNNASADPSQYPERLTRAVDADAVQFLSKGDLAFVGAETLSDDLCRWLYNSEDLGLYMASAGTRQVCVSCSTGIRLFPWQTIDAYPELTLGDSVILITDQYTDYDPARRIPLAGWLAIRGVIVHVGPDGRDFAVFVQGLLNSVQQVSWGGSGTAIRPNDAQSDSASLSDVTITDADDGTTVITFARGSMVSEVWASYAVIDAPEQASDFDLRVRPFVTPLPAGATSYVVPSPADKQITLVQIEPRLSDLATGHIERLRISSTAQVPHVQLDDVETATLGTQWVQFTERGIPVTLVEVQTQIGTNPVSAWGAPTRVVGAASTVKGGLLAALQYEFDVTLDPNRQSWVFVRYTLANGKVIHLPPFGFDRDKNPNLGSVSVDPSTGRYVTIIGDVDTKSVGLYAKVGTWKCETDGSFLVADVQALGTNGVAGLAAGTSGGFTAKAQSDPLAYLGGGTLVDARDVIAPNGAAATAAAWAIVTASAPANGSNVAAISLKATAAPAGWTVKLYIDYDAVSTTVVPVDDQTGVVTPALSAPPTASTVYSYTTGFVRGPSGSGSHLVTLKARADLLDGTGAVQDTRTVTTTWYSSSPL